MPPFFPQLRWDPDSLLTAKISASFAYALPKSLRKASFSLSALRFWFIYHFLPAENANRKPLDILELQADKGQLLDFIRQAAVRGYPAVSYRQWDAVVAAGEVNFFSNRHYTAILSEQELDGRLQTEKYDVLILPCCPGGPEKVKTHLDRLGRAVKPNGIIIGLFNRQTYGSSSDSRSGLRFNLARSLSRGWQFHRMVDAMGYSMDFLTGGYFRRDRGLVPQEQVMRFRLKLLLSALFPAQAGEIYWVLRK
jgi:hypothetical protein